MKGPLFLHLQKTDTHILYQTDGEGERWYRAKRWLDILNLSDDKIIELYILHTLR